MINTKKDREIAQAATAEDAFLVMSCGDGSYSSDLVFGLDNARRKLAEHLWFGTYEEACEDEMVAAFLAEFDNHEEHWDTDDSGYHGHGEQMWVEVRRVQELPVTLNPSHALEYIETVDKQARAIEAMREAIDAYHMCTPLHDYSEARLIQVMEANKGNSVGGICNARLLSMKVQAILSALNPAVSGEKGDG